MATLIPLMKRKERSQSKINTERGKPSKRWVKRIVRIISPEETEVALSTFKRSTRLV